MLADYPGCRLAIDLAGRREDDPGVSSNSEKIRDTAKAIVEQCVKGKGQGGFGTIHLTAVVDDLAKLYAGPWGLGL